MAPPAYIANDGRVRQAPPPWYTPTGFVRLLRDVFTTILFFLRTLFSADAAGEYRRWRLGRTGGRGGGGGGGGPVGGRRGQIFGLGQLKSVSGVPGGCKSCAGG